MKDDEELWVWDLKTDIAYFIVPRFTLLIEKIEAGELAAIPIWVENHNELLSRDHFSKEEIKDFTDRWVSILKEMLFSFQYAIDPYADEYKEFEKEALEEKVDKGLYLFAKYYFHLWD